MIILSVNLPLASLQQNKQKDVLRKEFQGKNSYKWWITGLGPNVCLFISPAALRRVRREKDMKSLNKQIKHPRADLSRRNLYSQPQWVNTISSLNIHLQIKPTKQNKLHTPTINR